MGTVSSISGWRTERPRFRADLFLSRDSLAGSDPVEGAHAGFDVHVVPVDAAMPIPPDATAASQVIIVEADGGRYGGHDRIQRLLAERPGTPVLAAMHEPSLGDVRNLMRAGVADVLPLPLRLSELEPALERIGSELDARQQGQSGPQGRLIAAIKSRGGVGATTLLTQLGCILSEASRFRGGPTCLVDFDIQLGNAALCLGQLPEIGLKELLDARERLDGSLLKSVIARHPTGLSYIAAPGDIMPLDMLRPEMVDPIVGLVRREFQTVLVDLPSAWTDWGLSILSGCDQVFLVCDLSVASLHQARRQLEFLREQELGQLPVSVVMNKVSKGLFKSVDHHDAARILGREVEFTIADDPATVRLALDQGEQVSVVNSRSRTVRDLGEIAASLQSRSAAVK